MGNLIVLPAIVIGLLSTAVLNLNNMRDRISDAKVNKNTVAVRLGETNAKRYHLLLIGFAFIFALIYFIIEENDILGFLPLLAFVPLFLHLKTVQKNTAPPLLDPELKKVALSTFLFSVLFFVSALF